MDKMLNKLLSVGFPTGSYHWGCSSPKDEDWVIKNSDWNEIIGTDLGLFYYISNSYNDVDFRCFYLNKNDSNEVRYNFIVPNCDDLYEKMKIATRLMDKIPTRFIENKLDRVYLFDCFKSIVRNNRGKTARPKRFDEDIPF